MRAVPPDHLEEGPGREFQRLPEVRQAFPHGCPDAAGDSCSTTASTRSSDGNLVLDRPAEVHRPEALRGAAEGGAEKDRAERRDHQRARASSNGRPVVVQRHGVRLHRRQHGRGGGRDDYARRWNRRLADAHAADHRLGLRRRAHDGRHDQPDAVGQDLRGAGAAGRRQAAVHLAC